MLFENPLRLIFGEKSLISPKFTFYSIYCKILNKLNFSSYFSKWNENMAILYFVKTHFFNTGAETGVKISEGWGSHAKSNYTHFFYYKNHDS